MKQPSGKPVKAAVKGAKLPQKGTKAIGPKQDDPITPIPTKSKAAKKAVVKKAGGTKAIGPKQDDPVTPIPVAKGSKKAVSKKTAGAKPAGAAVKKIAAKKK